MTIDRDDFFMGRDKEYASELTPEIEANSIATIAAVNAGLALFYADNGGAEQRHVNSGWRPPAVNAAAGGAAHSQHMLGNACDIGDVDRMLCLWSLRNVDRLRRCGILAMEKPEATPTWCHWQRVAVGSGVFSFWPSEAALVAWQKSGQPMMVP